MVHGACGGAIMKFVTQEPRFFSFVVSDTLFRAYLSSLVSAPFTLDALHAQFRASRNCGAKVPLEQW